MLSEAEPALTQDKIKAEVMEGYCLQDWRNIDKAGNNRSQVEDRQLSLKPRDKSSQAEKAEAKYQQGNHHVME